MAVASFSDCSRRGCSRVVCHHGTQDDQSQYTDVTFKKALVAAVAAGLRAKKCPSPAARPRDPQARKRHIDALLDYVRRRGAVLGIDPQLAPRGRN